MSLRDTGDPGPIIRRLGLTPDDEQPAYVEPVFHGRLITSTGACEYVKLGYSWATLFFGPLVPLFRGDLKYAIIILLTNFLLFPIFVWPCEYNTRYINGLLERGYYPETAEFRAGLILRGFPLES